MSRGSDIPKVRRMPSLDVFPSIRSRTTENESFDVHPKRCFIRTTHDYLQVFEQFVDHF